jgi:hypothetical protein
MEKERSGKGVVIAFVGAAVVLVAAFELLIRTERSTEPVRPNVEAAEPESRHAAPAAPSEHATPDLRAEVLKSAVPAEPAPTQAPDASEAPRAQPDAATEVHSALDAGQPFGTDQAGIRAAMQAAIPDLRECYDAWGKAVPGTVGNLNIHMTIAGQSDGGAPEGRVTGIAVGDERNPHLPVESCVMQVLSELRFAAPSAPLKVDYPITFKTVEPRF